MQQLRNIICTLYSIPLPPIQTETYSIKAPFYYCDLEVMAVQCYYIYSLQYVVVIKAYNVPVFLCLVPTTTNNQVFTRYDKLNIFIMLFIIFGQIIGHPLGNKKIPWNKIPGTESSRTEFQEWKIPGMENSRTVNSRENINYFEKIPGQFSSRTEFSRIF